VDQLAFDDVERMLLVVSSDQLLRYRVGPDQLQAADHYTSRSALAAVLVRPVGDHSGYLLIPESGSVQILDHRLKEIGRLDVEQLFPGTSPGITWCGGVLSRDHNTLFLFEGGFPSSTYQIDLPSMKGVRVLSKSNLKSLYSDDANAFLG
jgi:hypothetical protein